MMRPYLSCFFWNIKGDIEHLDRLLKDTQERPDVILLAEATKPLKSQKDDKDNPLVEGENSEKDTIPSETSAKTELNTAEPTNEEKQKVRENQCSKYLAENRYEMLVSFFGKDERSRCHSLFAVRKDLLNDFPIQPGNVCGSIHGRVAYCIIKRVLIFLVHLPDKLQYDEKSQMAFGAEIVRLIKHKERKLKGSFDCCLVVGDFNMNPFDGGMMLPFGFNAPYALIRYSKKKADFSDREVATFRYPYFYNPMWSYLGIANKLSIDKAITEPLGTYKLNSTSIYTEFRYNILDQVLIRAEFLDNFAIEKLQIRSDLNLYKKADKNGKETEKWHSDHHPISFELIEL